MHALAAAALAYHTQRFSFIECVGNAVDRKDRPLFGVETGREVFDLH